jgi:hypothetical protein
LNKKLEDEFKNATGIEGRYQQQLNELQDKVIFKFSTSNK